MVETVSVPLHLWDVDVTGPLLKFELEVDDGPTEIGSTTESRAKLSSPGATR